MTALDERAGLDDRAAKTQNDLLHELEPIVAENLDRHLAIAQEWHPHDYIPWSQGRDFAFLGGEDWAPEQSRLSETAKAAMVTNLLQVRRQSQLQITPRVKGSLASIECDKHAWHDGGDHIILVGKVRRACFEPILN